jgi:O-methyltransferase
LSEFSEKLITEATEALGTGASKVAIVGLSGEALLVAAALEKLGSTVSIFDPRLEESGHPRLSPWTELAPCQPDLVVIAVDREKQTLLKAAAKELDAQAPLPEVVLAGLGHQEELDPLFEELEAPALVPSYATGHPHTRAHLYDCLKAAAGNNCEGVVVEIGAFKGGTSVWLARAIRSLGMSDTKVIAFDSWDGFPPRRSLLDLYEHPRCVFRDLDAVRAYTAPHGIELVPGDIAETAPHRLADEPIVLAFIDTDNYSGARAALDPIRQNLVVGGAIVFDHYYTTKDYAYTIGERIAGSEALGTAGLLHLHGTGVFVKLV